MSQVIIMSPEELAQIVSTAVNKELKPIKDALLTKRISSQQARDILGIKDHKTLMKLVRDEKIRNVAENGGYPKFLFHEVVDYARESKNHKFNITR